MDVIQHHANAKKTVQIRKEIVTNIRRAKEEDAEKIAQLHIKSLISCGSDNYSNNNNVSERSRLIRDSIKKGNIYLVYELENNIIGFICAGSPRDNLDYEFEIYALYVHPEYFRKGIGKSLFEELARITKNYIDQRMYLWVLEDNVNARKFYESIGGNVNLAHRCLEDNMYKIIYYWD